MRLKWIAPVVIGVILAVFGLGVLLGGGKLASLGGSWYYLLAGALMIASGVQLARRKIAATWLALALLVITLVWSLWEVGFDFWQLVPRLMTFIVIALVLTLMVPLLEGDRRFLGKAPLTALCAVLIANIAGFAYGMFQPHPTVVAKEGSSAPVVVADAGESDGDDWTAYGRNTHGERFA